MLKALKAFSGRKRIRCFGLGKFKLAKRAREQGIETYYPYNLLAPEMKLDGKGNSELIEFLQAKAKELNLLESGDSDFHGGDRETKGKVPVPDSVLEKLKQVIT